MEIRFCLIRQACRRFMRGGGPEREFGFGEQKAKRRRDQQTPAEDLERHVDAARRLFQPADDVVAEMAAKIPDRIHQSHHGAENAGWHGLCRDGPEWRKARKWS